MAQMGSSDRSLSLIETAALSIALIGPSLVLAANGQAIALAVAQPIWLIFAVGMLGIGTVGHAFTRLLPLTNGPGSAYLAVQATLGSGIGRLAGVALLGAYLGFSLATPAAILSFSEAIYPPPSAGYSMAFKLSLMTIVMVLAALIVTRPNATIMRILLIVEVCGILLIAVLGIAIVMQPSFADMAGTMGKAAAVFDAGGFHLLDGVVVAFFSWAGFESCMTLAGSSKNPARDMPRALAISVIASGIVFIFMFALIEWGFDGKLGGRAALAGSANALADLGVAYMGSWSAMGFGIVALCSAFACLIAAITAAGSIGSSLLSRSETGGSLRALGIVIVIWGIEMLLIAVQPLIPVIPQAAIGLYGIFGGGGAVCIMLAYLLVLAGCIAALWTGKVHGSRIELLIPIIGLAFISFALLSTLSLSGGAAASSFIAIAFCVIGYALFALRSPSKPMETFA